MLVDEPSSTTRSQGTICRGGLYTSGMKSKRFMPLVNLALRRLRQRTDVDFSRLEAEIICPEETQACGPLIYLDGQLDRVKMGSPFNPLDVELEQIRATEVWHAPAIRYTLSDCMVHDAGFDKFKTSYRKSRLRQPDFLFSPVTEVASLSYGMTSTSHMFFGHWLQDALPAALLARPDEALLLDVLTDGAHAAQYVKAAELHPLPQGVYLARKLHFYQDFSQGPSKRARLATLRARLAANISDGQRYKPGSAVYFRRGHTGVARLIENEDELIRVLTDRGFEIFDLEGASVADIQQRFRHARMVVSIEGSQQCHLSFAMQPGACLISLIPSDRFTIVLLGYARAVDLLPGFLVIDPAKEGYRVNLSDLLRTLDLAEERLQNQPANNSPASHTAVNPAIP